MLINEQKLRKLIREVISLTLNPQTALHKMPFELVLDMMDDLDIKLTKGIINIRTYEKEHNEILRASGYSQEEFEQKLDDRWDYIENIRAVPEPERAFSKSKMN